MTPTSGSIEQTIRNQQPPRVLLNGMTHEDALKTIETTSTQVTKVDSPNYTNNRQLHKPQ